MRKTNTKAIPLLAAWLVLATGCALAQDNTEVAKASAVVNSSPRSQAGPFYHLEFVVKEVDGNKVINSRSYSTSIINEGRNSIRAGARVPTPSGNQYLDLGANFDCGEAHEVEGKLTLRVMAELSSVAANDQEAASKSLPVVRQNKWDADVIVPLGKATTIFSSDDVSSKNKLQVELTATLMK